MPIDQDALERLRYLRRLGVRRGARDLERPPARETISDPSDLPGEPWDTPYGSAWVCTLRYPLAEHPELAGPLDVKADVWAALGRDAELLAFDPARVAFIDTETTGLSLGTGTYTFLIGIGTYEEDDSPLTEGEDAPSAPDARPAQGAFVVRQFFMRNPGEERAQLHLVEEILSSCNSIVSFNGRAFDLPLLQNRFILARMPLPLPGAPHLDLLAPARRVWRAYLGSCALSSLERSVLGVQRTSEDVPGWLIPSIYNDYYSSGNNVAQMARVFYHNQEDILSMVLLANRLAPLFQLPPDEPHLAQLHPLECASLGRSYEALGWIEAGEAAYRIALTGNLHEAERARVYHDLATLLKRLGRRDEAALLWEEWISAVTETDLIPFVELAKYHEWHTGNLVSARGWIAWAIHLAERQPAGVLRGESLPELRHRLERLERKIANGDEVGSRE